MYMYVARYEKSGKEGKAHPGACRRPSHWQRRLTSHYHPSASKAHHDERRRDQTRDERAETRMSKERRAQTSGKVPGFSIRVHGSTSLDLRRGASRCAADSHVGMSP